VDYSNIHARACRVSVKKGEIQLRVKPVKDNKNAKTPTVIL